MVKTTTATIGDDNAVNFTAAETLYWDDYGTADPDNMVGEGNGRNKGLTIYGAAIDNKTTAPTVSDWSALSWEVPTNQTTSGSTPADKDLLISNNVKTGTSDGTYKFSEKTSGKLLKFTHALSKITVILTANNGFPVGSENKEFENSPQVTLTSNEAGLSTNAEWAYRTGTVDITDGTITSQGTPSAITMYQATANGHTVSFEALVMPGSEFTADNAIIARINADGNIYYVTAAKIREKITGDSKVTKAGKNYIINVTVDKTGISNVSATVASWTDISADNVAPVINLVGQLGGSASNWEADKSFSFYRSSTALNEGYSSNPALLVNSCYREESVLNFTNSSQTWSMSPVLYWPNHNTHYQFRAVWPQTVTTADDGNFTDPRVVSGVNSVAGLQIIKVKNVAYSGGTFPSDLMIARPNVEGNCGSKEPDAVHPKKNLYTEGICARTGAINLTFNYMMSKVGVNLSTKENSSDPDYVNLTNAKVEIVNVYNNGDVILGNRTVNCGNYSKNSYTLDVGASANNRLSAIVPQTFTYSSALASGNTKLRITIYNNGDTNSIDDIYEADLKTIPVQEGSSPAAAVDGWESGKSYVYNLRLTKTKVQVTASLTPWTEVTATQDIWF